MASAREFESESSSSLGGSSGYVADISNTTSYAVSEFSRFDDGYDADRSDFDSCSESSEGDDVDGSSESSEGDDVDGNSESSSREMDNVGSNDYVTCRKLKVLVTDSFRFTPASIMGLVSSFREFLSLDYTIERIQYCGNDRTDEGYILRFDVYTRTRSKQPGLPCNNNNDFGPDDDDDDDEPAVCREKISAGVCKEWEEDTHQECALFTGSSYLQRLVSSILGTFPLFNL